MERGFATSQEPEVILKSSLWKLGVYLTILFCAPWGLTLRSEHEASDLGVVGLELGDKTTLKPFWFVMQFVCAAQSLMSGSLVLGASWGRVLRALTFCAFPYSPCCTSFRQEVASQTFHFC